MSQPSGSHLLNSFRRSTFIRRRCRGGGVGSARGPDLAQAAAANRAAAATFEQLDAANRYAIVYRLSIVKRHTTRVRKLAEYIDMLARGECLHPRKPRKDRQ